MSILVNSIVTNFSGSADNKTKFSNHPANANLQSVPLITNVPQRRAIHGYKRSKLRRFPVFKKKGSR
jgi:hypothetical protein